MARAATCPRSPDARLFDASVLTRGLWQGSGLLLLLLALFGGAREWGASDDAARALTFAALVIASLGLILVNRTGNRAMGTAAIQSNPYFLWMTFASIAILTLILSVPVISTLFAFAPPSPTLTAIGLGVALVSTLWFECVKRALGKAPGGAGIKAQ